MDTAGLAQLSKLKQQMGEFGYSSIDTGPAVLHFLTRRLGSRDISDMQKLIPRRDLVEKWRRLDDDARDLGKRLSGKEAATPSRAWDLLSNARPETILFFELTTRQQAASQKIKNFFGKWRQVQQKIPLAEMVELRITPPMPEYPKIADQVFHLLLDGKLRSRTEILKFLKPLAPPPPPPPPPPPKRGRAAKAQVTPVATPAAAADAGKKGKEPGKKKGAPVPAPAPAAAAALTPAQKRPAAEAPKKAESKPQVAAKANTKASPKPKAKPAAKPAKPKGKKRR